MEDKAVWEPKSRRFRAWWRQAGCGGWAAAQEFEQDRGRSGPFLFEKQPNKLLAIATLSRPVCSSTFELLIMCSVMLCKGGETKCRLILIHRKHPFKPASQQLLQTLLLPNVFISLSLSLAKTLFFSNSGSRSRSRPVKMLHNISFIFKHQSSSWTFFRQLTRLHQSVITYLRAKK